MPWLINASQLDKFRKNQKNLVIFDATWHSTADGRPARAAFLDNHIAGARFLDINEFHDPDTALPNMLIRDEAVIAEKISAHGINNDCKIIFYDNNNAHTACRALWMFKVFGHHSNQLYILDGGLNAWAKFGGKMEAGDHRNVAAKPYQVDFQAQYIRTLVQMKSNLHHPREQVVDVRNPIRFAGGGEDRANMRSGHIPGSYCFPFSSLFESNGSWKSLDKIRKQLIGLGLELNLPIVTTCGSGITAPILSVALDLLGQEQNAVYDGSWTEWGSQHLYPGEESLDERLVHTSLG